MAGASREGPELPSLARRYVERAVPAATPVPTRVRIEQVGRMRLRPRGRWLPFTATQDYEVRRVAFTWRARFPILPLAWLTVVDGYEDGVGHLKARLWGLLPVMGAGGEEVAKGEALRYLSELVWTPHSIPANRELQWREIEDGAVEVAAAVGSSRVTLRIDFDARGDIVGVSTRARPRQVGKTMVGTPWRGEFDDYATVGGIRIPRTGRVGWELPEGPFTYWEGRITGLDVH